MASFLFDNVEKNQVACKLVWTFGGGFGSDSCGQVFSHLDQGFRAELVGDVSVGEPADDLVVVLDFFHQVTFVESSHRRVSLAALCCGWWRVDYSLWRA
jgi:hypothetical protein